MKKPRPPEPDDAPARPNQAGSDWASNRPLERMDYAQAAPENVASQAPEGWTAEATAPTAGEDVADALAVYLRGVRRTTLFTPEEEFNMAVRARALAGDQRIEQLGDALGGGWSGLSRLAQCSILAWVSCGGARGAMGSGDR